MSRTSTGINYNARSMNGIISINADEITCSGTITSDLIKANNLLEGDTAETISGLWNFTTLPYSTTSATTAFQFTNKTYVDSAILASLTNYVDLTSTQTISGLKTFSSNVRINTSRSLLLGTGATTGIIQYSAPGLFFDINGLSTHFFFINGVPIVDIGGSGLVIRTGKNLSFYGGSSFTENTGGNTFDINIPTAFQYNLKINSVNKFQIHQTFGAYIADNLNMTTQKYINWSGGSFQQEDSAGSAYVYNVPTALYSHSFKFANVEKLKISSDANGGIITFSGGIVMREYTGFQWLLYQLPASNVLKYQVAGNDIMEIAGGGAIIYESLSMRDGKTIKWDEGFVEVAQIRKDKVNKYLEYEVASTYRHRFSVNNVEQLSVNTTGATFTGGIYMKAGQAIFPDDTFLGGAISGTSGSIRFDADTGGNFTFINDSTLALTIDGTNITIPANQTLQFGPTGSNITHFAGTTLRYNVPTGDTHVFRINAIDQLQILPAGIKTTGGYFTKLGSGGAFQASVFNNAWTFPNYTAYIDGTNIGNYVLCDARLKKNIVKARPILDRLCGLSMIEYTYIENGIFKDDGIRHYGYIAQEIKKEFPEFPNFTTGEETDMTDDGNIQPIRVNSEFSNIFMGAIQELNAKVEAQQKIIEAQQKQIDALLVLFSQSR